MLTIATAYPLSRRDFFGRRLFIWALLIALMFNGGLIPFYLVVKNLGLIDTVLPRLPTHMHYCRTGVNAILMPGATLGPSSCIGPGVAVYEDVPAHTLLVARQELVRRSWDQNNMADDRIRVVLVGAGSMGQVHAAAFAGIPGVAITAVVEHDPERAGALAASLGVAPYTELEAMLSHGPVDAVDCCLPTPLHRPTVEWAAAHGLPIICEKPLALGVEDGRAIIAACRAAGVVLATAFPMRHSLPAQQVKGPSARASWAPCWRCAPPTMAGCPPAGSWIRPWPGAAP